MAAVIRNMTKAIEAAAAAARAEDADGLTEAVGELSKLDAAQTGKVLGGVLRLLLEQQHPDGLDSDDIKSVLEETVRGAASWLPETDPHTLLIVLAGALGIHPDDHEEVTRPAPESLSFNAPLLIAHLLGPAKSVKPYVEATFANIAQTELMEEP